MHTFLSNTCRGRMYLYDAHEHNITHIHSGLLCPTIEYVTVWCRTPTVCITNPIIITLPTIEDQSDAHRSFTRPLTFTTLIISQPASQQANLPCPYQPSVPTWPHYCQQAQNALNLHCNKCVSSFLHTNKNIFQWLYRIADIPLSNNQQGDDNSTRCNF